jgi:hypothetical protein
MSRDVTPIPKETRLWNCRKGVKSCSRAAPCPSCRGARNRRWQFSAAWACHFGLPCDIAHWTPAQQDAAARALWAGGRGCSNWAAC